MVAETCSPPPPKMQEGKKEGETDLVNILAAARGMTDQKTPPLVPQQVDDAVGGDNTPPTQCLVPRTGDEPWTAALHKASTPNPAKFSLQHFGASTPPPARKYFALHGASTGDRSSILKEAAAATGAVDPCYSLQHLQFPDNDESNTVAEDTNTQHHDAAPFQHPPQHQMQDDNLRQHLHQQQPQAQLQPQLQQQQQQQHQGPGTLYPVWEDGNLVGYMAVPATNAAAPAPAGRNERPASHVPESNYLTPAGLGGSNTINQFFGAAGGGIDGIQSALSDLHINHAHRYQSRLPNAKETVHHQQQLVSQPDWGANEAGIEIFSIRGRIIEVSRDHAGSRALQRRLDMGCTDEEKQALFDEVEPKLAELMVHMFGNYVVQKLFEHGLPHHVQVLSNKLRGNVLSLTLSPYGCRVVQKALEVIEPKYKTMIVNELTGQVPRCVQDQNGNHVIQKCIETMPNRVHFIVAAFRNNVQALAMHAYGCRVIQRLLEYCKRSAEVEPIIQEVLASVDQLVGDRYGNYVVQHVIINGEPRHRTFVFNRLKGSTLALARGKFSSNVVEKMFEFGSHQEREDLLSELLNYNTPDGMSGLLAMVQDPFANYVVQKMLDCCDDTHQRVITEHIRPHVASLRKFNYGKHIISRLEKAGMTLSNGTSKPLPAAHGSMLHPHLQQLQMDADFLAQQTLFGQQQQQNPAFTHDPPMPALVNQSAIRFPGA